MSEYLHEDLCHPIRNHILNAIQRLGKANTREILMALPHISQSAIYRHLRDLLEHNLIEIVHLRQVHGAKERTYSLCEGIVVDAENLDLGISLEWSHAVRTHYLNMLYILDKFDREFPTGLEKYGSNFTPSSAWLSPEEAKELGQKINALLASVADNPKTDSRKLMSLSYLVAPASHAWDEEEVESIV